mmetsp:Transcript_76762/g.176098  ORF Transcript_76762/g.176098 Transcript_76762/m.176098 type:complete len:91 (+) Transcript_76762:484-756(+)
MKVVETERVSDCSASTAAKARTSWCAEYHSAAVVVFFFVPASPPFSATPLLWLRRRKERLIASLTFSTMCQIVFGTAVSVLLLSYTAQVV